MITINIEASTQEELQSAIIQYLERCGYIINNPAITIPPSSAAAARTEPAPAKDVSNSTSAPVQAASSSSSATITDLQIRQAVLAMAKVLGSAPARAEIAKIAGTHSSIKDLSQRQREAVIARAEEITNGQAHSNQQRG